MCNENKRKKKQLPHNFLMKSKVRKGRFKDRLSHFNELQVTDSISATYVYESTNSQVASESGKDGLSSVVTQTSTTKLTMACTQEWWC